MFMRMWLEVGHACEPRKSATGRALSLDWRVWVKGARGDISTFIQKVVFKLHPPSAFVYPKRVRQEPPYEIQESGCASIDIPIHLYLKDTNKPKKICLKYYLYIENNNKATTNSRCVYYDFENPSETLCSALMKAGGEVIGLTTKNRHSLIALFHNKPRDLKLKRQKQVDSIRCKHVTTMPQSCRLLEDICSKCGASISPEFKQQLRLVKMTEEEINRVLELYLSFRSYEKSVDSLILPPISNPIYNLPELPPSLQNAVTSVEADYAMQ